MRSTITENGPFYVLTVGRWADENVIGVTAAADQAGADRIADLISAEREASGNFPRDMITVSAVAAPLYTANGEIL